MPVSRLKSSSPVCDHCDDSRAAFRVGRTLPSRPPRVAGRGSPGLWLASQCSPLLCSRRPLRRVRTAGEAQPLRLSMTLPRAGVWRSRAVAGEPTSLVVSPDGRRVAIVARRGDGPFTILMRELDSPSARLLAGTEGATSLFWSPDSRFIGFFADGKLKKVDVSGGVPTVLCDASTPFGGGTWSGEGIIVFSMPEKGELQALEGRRRRRPADGCAAGRARA